MEELRRKNVTDLKEIEAILRLSDYGRKNAQIWITFAQTNWVKINTPGKYIIAELNKRRKHPE